MWASRIIDTSFAPSPIAKVTVFGSSSFISLTTSAFYAGDTLQHITASHVLDIFKKCLLIVNESSSSTFLSAPASIKIALYI